MMIEDEDTAVNSTGKQRGRPFKKGQSGNPTGRPAGSRNRATIVLDTIAEGRAGEVLTTIINAALSGDMTAAKIVADRIWPAKKSRTVDISLPDVSNGSNIVAAMSSIVEGINSGTLTPQEATALASIVETARRALETQELERRLENLESQR